MSDGRVFLHIGLKKTGTSYLQSVLRANRDTLRSQGLDLVPPSQPASHRLTLDLRRDGGPAPGGPLARLPRQLDQAAGPRLLITEETFAGLRDDQVARLGAALGGRDPHLVLTVRDIARTIPSAWQQAVKGGRGFRYPTFVESVVRRSGPGSQGFWTAYDVPALLQTWETLVPRDRMHVVLVPPPGAPRELLLQRFCAVVGVDPGSLAVPAVRANESLGRAQAELLRRINRKLSETAKQRAVHGAVLKRGFALGVLAPQGGERILVPAEHAPWCRQHAKEVAAFLAGGGYHLVGDPAELMPDESAFAEGDVEVADQEVSAAAVAALAELLERQMADWLAAQKGDAS